jgi:hypothetical protein
VSRGLQGLDDDAWRTCFARLQLIARRMRFGFCAAVVQVASLQPACCLLRAAFSPYRAVVGCGAHGMAFVWVLRAHLVGLASAVRLPYRRGIGAACPSFVCFV